MRIYDLYDHRDNWAKSLCVKDMNVGHKPVSI